MMIYYAMIAWYIDGPWIRLDGQHETYNEACDAAQKYCSDNGCVSWDIDVED